MVIGILNSINWEEREKTQFNFILSEGSIRIWGRGRGGGRQQGRMGQLRLMCHHELRKECSGLGLQRKGRQFP